MYKYVRRTFCLYAAAAAVMPLSTRGNDGAVPAQPAPPPPPHHDAHWHAGGAAVYGQHHQPSPYGPGAIPPPHPQTHHHPYAAPPPPPPMPHQQTADHKEAATATAAAAGHATGKHLTLWEQSAGTFDLPTHSWQPPLSHEHLSHWDVAMSTIPLEGHVLLVPGEANRTGQLWHRNALPSEQFEIQFGFGVFNKEQQAHAAAASNHSADGFAFWYVYEPYANVYPRSPDEQAAWNLMGYKRNPKGLGIIFKSTDKDGNTNPSISCIHNTEDEKQLGEEIPSSNALFYQYRNLNSVRKDKTNKVIINHQGPGYLSVHSSTCCCVPTDSSASPASTNQQQQNSSSSTSSSSSSREEEIKCSSTL
ncbi:hypothetical protein Efla_004302 [Eimeria flavescens]